MYTLIFKIGSNITGYVNKDNYEVIDIKGFYRINYSLLRKDHYAIKKTLILRDFEK